MSKARQIKVLIVDDSAVSRAALKFALESDPAITVIGQSSSGSEAIADLARLKPDIVTMDIHMPGVDGFETTRQIMETRPLPVVIVSSNFSANDTAKTFRAMEAGALAAVEKPPGLKHPEHATSVHHLVRTVRAMSGVKVVRRRPRENSKADSAGPVEVTKIDHRDIRFIAIGASTGGPPVLRTVLADLPKPFPLPVVIVQHISTGFVDGLADWLSSTTNMPVRIARDGEVAEAGCAYIAPDGLQAGVDAKGCLHCVDEPPEHGLRPSVSYLFRSVARNFGSGAVGVLLTGMGSDGAVELKMMRDRGAVTIAQDRQSSVVHGMPGEAIRLGAASHTGTPEEIAALLQSLIAPR